MADSACYIELASNNGDFFANSSTDDIMIRPEYSTQEILIGTSNGAVSTMTIRSNSIGILQGTPAYTLDINGNVNFTGSLYQNGTIFTSGGGSSQWSNSGANVFLLSSNVGIGTNSPSFSLQVSSNTTGGATIALDNPNTAGWTHMCARNTTSTVNGGMRMGMLGTTWTNSGIYLQNSGFLECEHSNGISIAATSNTASLRFYAGGTTEAMRVNSNTNVGIGTTAPIYKLDVAGTINSSGNLTGPTITSLSNLGVFASNAGLWSSNNLYNKAGGTISGNVVITGTTALSNTLTLYSTSGGGAATMVMNSTAGSGGRDYRVISTLTGNAGGAGAFQIYDQTAPATRLHIDSNGNIGVGTTTPLSRLDVRGGTIFATNTGGVKLQIDNDTTTQKHIVLYDTYNNQHQFYGFGLNPGVFRFQVEATTNVFAFYAATSSTASSELMRINGNGNVGIGTTSPGQKLDVNGTVRVVGDVLMSSNVRLSIYNDTGALQIRSGGGNTLFLNQDNTGNVSMVAGGGNVGIGTTSPGSGYKLDVNGNGRFIGSITACNSTINTSNEIGISPNAYNSLLIWDDQKSTTTFTGSIWGSATRDTTNGWIQLTSATNGQVGYVSYPFNPGNAFHLSFDYFAGGGNGADGLHVAFYNTSSNADNSNTGYNIYFDEYNVNGTNNDRVLTIAGGAVLDTWDLGTTGYLDNSTWKRIDIQYIRGTIAISIDGTRTRTISDTTERSFIWNTNTFLGFTGKTGGANNIHRIENIRVSKLDQGIWSMTSMSNTANIYYPYGNVGVGTIAPGAKLDVLGDVKITNNNNALHLNLSNNNSPFLQIHGSNGVISLGVASSATAHSTDAVAGDVVLKNYGVGTGKLLLQVQNGASAICINSNNNVGVNTTSPITRFQIQADGTGLFAMDNGVGQLIISGATDSTKRLGLGIDTTSNVGMIQAGKFGTGSYQLALNGAGGFVSVGKKTSANSALDVNGQITVNNDFGWTTGGIRFRDVSGAVDAAIVQGNNGALIYRSGASDGSNGHIWFNAGGASTIMRLTNPGNLGLPTASAYRLDVTSNINISGGDGWGSGLILGGAFERIYRETATTSYRGTVAHFDTSSNFTFMTTGAVTRMQITGGGNVGIGLNSPSYLLHAYTNTNGSVNIAVDNPNTNSGAWCGYLARNSASEMRMGIVSTTWVTSVPFVTDGGFVDNNGAGGISIAARNASGAIRFYAGGNTEHMRINNNGNVGIGLTGPGYKLDVSGDLRASGEIISTGTNSFRSVQGNYGVIHRNDGSDYWILLTASGSPYGTWNSLRPLRINLASGGLYFGNNALYVADSGNVGVGTTSPGWKFEVNGDVRIPDNFALMSGTSTGFLRMLGAGNATYIQSGLNSANNSAAPLVFGTINNATEWARFDNTGRLGIGTTSISYKLHVSGDIYATGDVIGFSDIRLKSNINIIDDALAKIHKINGYTFNLPNDDKRHSGLIAQEVLEVLPEVVHQEKKDDGTEGYYSLAYGNMVGIIVEAIKEVDNKYKTQIQNLQEQISVLMNELNNLKNKA